MKEILKQRHFIVLYVLIAVLGVWMLLVSTQAATSSAPSDGEWVCLQTVCSQSEPGGELWAQENCGFVEDENGQQVEACQVVIDGEEQVIRKDAINLSAIRNCLEYQCVQEVKVRETNYTVEEAVIAGQ